MHEVGSRHFVDNFIKYCFIKSKDSVRNIKPTCLIRLLQLTVMASTVNTVTTVWAVMARKGIP